MARLVFDTNVCGKIASSPNKSSIVLQLRGRYKIAASVNTLYELLLGLCRSQREEYFDNDKELLRLAIGYGTLANAIFLDHGLVFALWHGAKVKVSETGSGKRLFRNYLQLVLKAPSLRALKSGVRWSSPSQGRFLKCDVVEADFANLKAQYRLDVGSPLPDRTSWARYLGGIVNCELNDEQARAFGDALDGLYTYEQWLGNARKSTFNPQKNENDRMDMHQLFYLADPSIEFITEEEKIRKRIAASPQAPRVVLLRELLLREGLSL